jgi:hypothetical protein
VIPLIVIGCILLLFVILLTAHAHIIIEVKESMNLTVRFLGIPFHILHDKPPKYNPRNYTLKKIRKRDAELAKSKEEAARKKKNKPKRPKPSKKELRERKAQKRAAHPALTDFIPLICRTVTAFTSRFFGKVHIKIAKIHVRVGGSDAMQIAVLYGGINQSVQYLVEFLRRNCRMSSLKKADILIEPDFLSDSIEYECNLTIRVSLGNLLGALIREGWKFFLGLRRIKPDPNHPKGFKPPKAPSPPTPPKPDPIPRPDAPEPRA